MKKIKQSLIKIIKNNSGSTLITVLVAIAFVIILVSIILGTTLVNMSMKGIDRRVKDDFYYAEKGLGDVFIGIGQKTAEFAGKQYDKVFNQIGKSGGYDSSDDARNAFAQAFLMNCYSEYHDDNAANRISKLDAYIVHTVLSSRIDSINVISAGDAKYKLKNGILSSTFSDDTVAVVIPDVSVSAKDKNDYQSTVTTDIVIECPTVDFLGTNAEITDYALIGCQGVYFTSSDTSNNSIEVSGNLYGGLHETANSYDTQMFSAGTPVNHPYGGINVYSSKVNINGSYIVAKGDINIGGSNSELKIGTSDMTAGIPAVWFDTMRTVGGAVKPAAVINANMYALNDLELNADQSNIRLKGDYYGYNDKTLLLDTEHSLSYSSADARDDADSSAIIINGNKCLLDMDEVHSLVLMGKAYIDFTSKGDVPSGSPKIAASAESLALQTNQQLYVVPTDFLTGPNPATDENYNPITGFTLNKKREDMEEWFGYKYVKRVETSETNKTEIVSANEISDKYMVDVDNGLGGKERVYYAYLKFNDKLWQKEESTGMYKPAVDNLGNPVTKIGSFGSVSSKTAFFDEIMSSTEANDIGLQPSAFRLRKKILDSVKNSAHFDLKKCVVNNSGSEVIYGRNAIVSYDTENGVYSVRDNTEGMERFAGYPENLFKRYQLMCVYLNGKEDLKLSDPVSFSSNETSKIASDWKKGPVTSPMDNFVLVSAMASKNTSTDSEIDSGGKFGKCIVAPSYTVTASTKVKGVILVLGNVIVRSGAEVDGLIMATGTITVEGGSTGAPTRIKANKGLIQSRVEKEISLVEEGSAYKDKYLINYLTSDGTNKMYNITPGGKKVENRIKPDYNSFMHYENWKKGNR